MVLRDLLRLQRSGSLKEQMMATYNALKFDVKGDGKTDDTSAFNKAVKALGKNDVLSVPAGKYMINAATGISLKSDMTFRMLPGAELHVIPNDLWKYSLIRVYSANNVTIEGGKLVGDRAKHKPKARPDWKPSVPWNKYGEWGFGLDIRGSHDVEVKHTNVYDMWGDGFYISNKNHGKDKAKRIKLTQVGAYNNRRQGLSVIAVSNLIVLNSVFRDTRGTRPAAGIDFEPDLADPKNVIEDVLIKGSRFYNNQGAGIEFAVKKGITRNVVVTSDNKFGNNNKSIKSSTFSWWQNLIYSIFGWPKALRIR